MTEQTNILATVVPAELTARLDRYLKEHDIEKKDFVTQVITRALKEAEAGQN